MNVMNALYSLHRVSHEDINFVMRLGYNNSVHIFVGILYKYTSGILILEYLINMYVFSGVMIYSMES